MASVACVTLAACGSAGRDSADTIAVANAPATNASPTGGTAAAAPARDTATTPRTVANATASAPRPSAGRDSLIGRISEAGADPATWISLRPASGRAVRLAGNVTPLKNLTGAVVWVSGSSKADGFDVDLFEVRQADGIPVYDGVVVVDGDVRVRTRTGELHSIAHAPRSLRALAGARVGVTRTGANQAPNFGVIVPAGQ